MGWDFGIIKEFFDFDKYRISHSLVITVIIITVVLLLCLIIFGFKNNSFGNWVKGLIVIFAATFSLVLWHDYQIKKEIEQETTNQSIANLGRSDESENKLSPNFNVPEPKLTAEPVIVRPQQIGGNVQPSEVIPSPPVVYYNQQPVNNSDNAELLKRINEQLNSIL